MSEHTDSPSTASGQERAGEHRARILLVVVALLITVVAYFNAVQGEFVYDDNFQIVQNPLIQKGGDLWRALTSDVWAFKGEREQAWSNYWRPMFILWLVANERLFGLHPAGWHVTNIVLHALVVVLAAGMLRRLDLRPAVSALILWVFAAHPVHTESVTWISGSPDLLVGAFLLASLNTYLSHRKAGRTGIPWLSLALFVGATLSKEVSFLFPALILVWAWALSGATPGRLRRSLLDMLPYAGVAAVMLIVRFFVLGMVAKSTPWAPDPLTIVLSVPAVFSFYLRQALWPATLGPAYPLRAVDPAAPGLTDVVLPCLVVLVVWAAGLALWRRKPVYPIGMALFVLPLLPAMNIAAYLPEQIVHDRYLYLPLLGLVIVIASALAELAERAGGWSRRSDIAFYAVAALLSGVLTVVTIGYNRVWWNEQALWERGVQVDPNSSHTLSQLGNVYRRAGRTDEAKELLRRAAEAIPTGRVTQVELDVAIIARREQRYDEASRILREILESYPDHEIALDQLGMTLSEQGRPEEAEQVFLQARERLPYRRVKYTINIAVLNRQMNRPERALAELESILDELEHETDPGSLRAYFFLGILYRASGRPEQAQSMLEEYLRRTEGMSGPAVDGNRQNAQRVLELLE